MLTLFSRGAEWVWRRVVLASPHCWLWEDCYIGKGRGKRLILWPSLVITGRELWEAKQAVRERGKRIRPAFGVAWLTISIPYPVVTQWN